MGRIIVVLFILGLNACGYKSLKVSADNSVLVRLDSLVLAEHQLDKFHGTIQINKGDSILYKKAIGIADRSWDIPMGSDTRFDIASLNKSFIAALVLLAVEEERFSLDSKMSDLLEQFDYSGQFDPEITLHQMLSHTSGLPDYEAVNDSLSNNGFKAFKRLHFSNGNYVDFISQLPTKGQAGKQFYYSNFAYHLLAIILESSYKESFANLLQTKICQPLGLASTYSTVSNEELQPKLAKAYSYDEQRQVWRSNNFIDLTLGRRIFSTVADLNVWAQAMDSDLILSQESIKLMQTNHLSQINPEISYGYGWAVFDGRGEYKMGNLGIDLPYIIHGGATEGYKSMLVNINKGEYIISFLSNVGNRTNEMQLAQKITNILIP